MLKAYKYRIYPNKEQRIYLAKTFVCTRFIYNLMLAEKLSLMLDFLSSKEKPILITTQAIIN